MKAESNIELIVLKTDRPDPLRVTRDDPVFPMGRDVALGRNVLAFGASGTGKSVRGEVLSKPANYPLLLRGTALEKIEMEVVLIDIDLTPVLANLELLYEQNIENGTSRRSAVNIAQFILEHGKATEEEFRAQAQANREAITRGEGRVRRWLLKVDDFDRVQNKMITNSFMKFIENKRHVLWTGDIRYLNLQCIASSNNTCGRSGGKYLASQGIDLAIYNRFQAYQVEETSNYSRILKAEFSGANQDEFIDRLVEMAAQIKAEMAEGAFESVGLISFRQLRPIVEDVVLCGVQPAEAASKLLSAVGRGSEDRLKADLIYNRFFGIHGAARPRFSF